MQVTIEKVKNGYLITTSDGQVFVSTRIDSYSYTGYTVVEVLKNIFEPVEKAE